MDNENAVEPSTSSFSALRAIYDPEFETESETKVHDNVERCVAFLEGRWRQKPNKSKEKTEPETEEVLQRQFLPSQLPLASRGRNTFRHGFKRMGEANSK